MMVYNDKMDFQYSLPMSFMDIEAKRQAFHALYGTYPLLFVTGTLRDKKGEIIYLKNWRLAHIGSPSCMHLDIIIDGEIHSFMPNAEFLQDKNACIRFAGV